jgi:hypothetical protein
VALRRGLSTQIVSSGQNSHQGSRDDRRPEKRKRMPQVQGLLLGLIAGASNCAETISGFGSIVFT